MNAIFSFLVNVKGREWATTINARTRGQAKSEYFRSVTDAWPSTKWTDLTCHKLGPAFTSEQFANNAIYRGMPDIKCGQRVRVGESTGTVTGHDPSANFEVLFDEDDAKYHGLRLSVHPSELVIL